MMKLSKTLLTLLVLGLLMFPASVAHATPADQQTIKDNIVAMWAAVEKGDVPTYMTYIHPDYSSFGEGDLYLQEGKDKERASYDDWMSRVRDVRTFMHQPAVTVKGDTAWITYYWTDSGYNKKSGERFTSRGKSTRIFVKENGKWLCIHAHFTAVD